MVERIECETVGGGGGEDVKEESYSTQMKNMSKAIKT
jgi:hypothetical protein